VNRYGSGHSEAIVTGATESARAFTTGVDAACVYVNASTRFTDGACSGWAPRSALDQKLHARGPIGLRELTTYKFVAEGSAGPRSNTFARRHPRRSIQSAAHRSPGVRAGGADPSSELDKVVFVPVGQAPPPRAPGDPGAEERLLQ